MLSSLDGIYIDSALNVLPYKNKPFDKNELKKSVEVNGAEYLIAQIGLHFTYHSNNSKVSRN